MATIDGYVPYPITLTAVQAKNAILRSFNLTAELTGYVAFSSTTTPPTLLTGIKDGDVWNDSAAGKRYLAYVDVTNVANHVLVFFEI